MGLTTFCITGQSGGLIKKAYRTYFMSKLKRKEALFKIKSDFPQSDQIKAIIKFIESSERGII